MYSMLDLLLSPTNNTFFSLFLKAFAVLFSIMYLLYAIVMTRQTQIMNKTLKTTRAPLFNFISLLQVLMGVILLIASVLLI